MVRGRSKKQLAGKFVTIEGGEGVGKTSLSKGLTVSLSYEGIEVVRSREPGGTPLGDRIRGVFKNHPIAGVIEKIQPETELLLISAARAQHVRGVIEPALKEGKLVLCDRFADSTRVYQGGLGGLQTKMIEQAVAMSTFGIEPNLTILLESEFAVVKERLAGRDPSDAVMRYDPATEEDHYAIQDRFKQLQRQHPERIMCLNTSKLTVSEAVDEARNILRDKLNL